MKSQASVGVTLIKIACLYLMAALLLGLFMAMRTDYSLVSVHTHLGVLGWATMGIAGVVYLVLPRCARSPLARLHFWLHNIGLPLMMAGLTVAVVFGERRVEPVIAIGSMMVIAALLAFTANVIANARAADVQDLNVQHRATEGAGARL